MPIDINTLLNLPAEEKRLIAEALWDSLNPEEEGALSFEEKYLLQERLNKFKEGKTNLHGWEEVKNKIVTSSK